MSIAAITALSCIAGLVEAGVGSVPAGKGAQMLRAFLSNDTLVWGCLAMALVALVSVGKVASRRRRAGQANRMARAQSDAMHGFFNALRSTHGACSKGLWHYDFITGRQQYSDGLKGVLGQGRAEPPTLEEIEARLKEAGLNLVRLASDHFEQTDPYEVTFLLKDKNQTLRPMVLRACNLRDGKGEVRRMIAVIGEADPEPN